MSYVSYISLLFLLNSKQILSEDIECGWPGISEKQCKERGCNWNTEEGLYCEGVPDLEMIDCGWYGISHDECVSRGCTTDCTKGPYCCAKAQYAKCPESDTKVFVHYMLWYGELGVGHWGQNYYPEFDIETDGCDNEQHVPTWFPPINPPGAFRYYNPAHILRDILLFKYACIDGVIIDYQGMEATEEIVWALPRVFDAVERSGLQWAVMYDTSSIPNPDIRTNWIKIIERAKESPNYLQDQAGNKLFFAFASTPFPNKNEIECDDCIFYSQYGREDGGVVESPGQGIGAFSWIEPQQYNKDGIEWLNRFYSNSCGGRYPDTPIPCVGAAFAGFHAVYVDYGIIPRSGDLLFETLNLCQQHATICQIPTWNDFNEGTHIEPSNWCSDGGSPGGIPIGFLDIIRDFKLSSGSAI